MVLIPCQCCKQEFPQSWNWYICDCCRYRICSSCLENHSGPYAQAGGFKCSQCAVGYLKGPASYDIDKKN